VNFLDALNNAKNCKKNIVIPDIKCFSPKEGDLMRGRKPVDYALRLQSAGAPVISVVTEEKEFHGSLEMLKEIAAAVTVPILRKDFIHTREDLIATKEAGASAILLMCSCLEKDELKYLYKEALKIGLDPFVETHLEEDFELVNELGAKLVGINNRDILVLERDDGNVEKTISLAKLAPEDAFLITESSIVNPSQVRAAISAGADAALVGTAILNADYTEAFYKMMCRKISLKILREEKISVFSGTEADKVEGILMYVPKLWEKYIENYLRNIKYKAQDKIRILDVNSSGEYRQLTQPDFVFYNEETPFMILDAKFKPGWMNVATTGEIGELLFDDYNKCLRDMVSINSHASGVIFPTNDVIENKNDEFIKADDSFEYKHNISKYNSVDKFYTFPIFIPKVEGEFSLWKQKFNDNCLKTFEIIKQTVNQNALK